MHKWCRERLPAAGSWSARPQARVRRSVQNRSEEREPGRASACSTATERVMVSTRRVVVTGLGLVSPLGLDSVSFWSSLAVGRSGVRPLQLFDASALPVRFGGEVLNFDP